MRAKSSHLVLLQRLLPLELQLLQLRHGLLQRLLLQDALLLQLLLLRLCRLNGLLLRAVPLFQFCPLRRLFLQQPATQRTLGSHPAGDPLQRTVI